MAAIISAFDKLLWFIGGMGWLCLVLLVAATVLTLMSWYLDTKQSQPKE